MKTRQVKKVLLRPKGGKMQKKSPSGNSNSGNYGKNLTIVNKKGNKLMTVVKTENEPIVVSRSIRMPAPKFGVGKNGSVVLTHTELLTTVTTNNLGENSNGFNIIGIHVNAGLKSSFPFLSSIAYNYKSYDFAKLCYGFVSRCPTITSGAVMMYAEYDPSVSPPENRIEFMNRSNAQEVQVFKNLSYSLGRKDMKKEASHYIRLGPLGKDQDIKLYDTAILWIGYEGTPKNTLIGDIFVTYDVSLVTPTIRLAEKQIKNIETTIGTNPIADSATASAPFGPALAAGSFVGDFLGALLNTATGGISGTVISTAKTIFKMVSAFLPPKLGVTPDSLDIAVSVMHMNYDGYNVKGDSFMILDEDQNDAMSTAINAIDQDDFDSKFIDITSTNAVKALDAVDVSSQRFIQWYVAVPQGGLVRIKHVQGATKFAGGKPSLTISDMDSRKLGFLNNNTLFGINDL